MQKIMFNDKYHLTQAVIDGRKLHTRRMPSSKIYGELTAECNPIRIDEHRMGVNSHSIKSHFPKYKIGEIVAVAQSYYDIMESGVKVPYKFDINITSHKGWNNKMFVKADLMPHQIQIIDVRLERLQDISEGDCLMEYPECDVIREKHVKKAVSMGASVLYNWMARKDVFAWLIDKINGKGTWKSNPYVFVYELKLIK